MTTAMQETTKAAAADAPPRNGTNGPVVHSNQVAELERQLRTLRIANSVLLGIAMAALLVAALAFVRTGDTSGEVSSLASNVDATGLQVADLDARAATLRADLDARAAEIDGRATELETLMAELRTDLDALDELAAAGAEDVEQLQARLDEVAVTLGEIEALVADVEPGLPPSR